MKLVDLIVFFRHGGRFEDFCKEHSLDVESEVIEIYAQEPVSQESPLGFFSIEETEGRVAFQAQGITYHNLFDFYYFLEVIEDLKGGQGPDNEELARQLLAYAIEDA